ncbi:MAG: DUF2345 domain-containing protein, partial [Proteobacteria bacterium]|nr:DUF2345 domain-containing protein [Pseudomonadota bacterium]
RGQGAELRTDGHGALRAQKGLLITTEARPNAQAHITDMGETVARLTAARDLHEGLSEAAMQARAHEGGDSDQVTKELKRQNEEVKGTSQGNREQGQFPEFETPHLTIASPAGIEVTTAGSTHIASNEHNAITSGGHTSIAAGKSLLVSAKEAVRVAAFEKGIRLVAAAADIDVQALKDSINILAKLEIRQEANRITITAKEEIVINGGTSYSQWNALGIVHGTNGLWREHAATHSLMGPASSPVNVQGFPSASFSRYDETFRLLDPAGQPMPHIDYEITGAQDDGHDAKTLQHTGGTPRISTKAPEKLRFSLPWPDIDVDGNAQTGGPDQEGKSNS